ncbi:MAG: methylmalonyl-CoA mutase family protein [Candidatus Thalassarchaeaceae archaeon]|nr:methylmalonyl-CoA mutase family protein [Candidatus Thalassarchaeaceae archaeon]
MVSGTGESAESTSGPTKSMTQSPRRVVTAASLFDGHDAAINVMRRLIQAAGAEVIHLGHDRSAQDVANAVIQEDAHAVALSSYQGGHVEYFTYIRQILDDAGRDYVKIFGGGGGTITPIEMRDLHEAGITKIYSPDDGRTLGLVGMIDDMMEKTNDLDLLDGGKLNELSNSLTPADHGAIARLITLAENGDSTSFKSALDKCRSQPSDKEAPVVGITGTGGAGKSSLLDELMLRIIRDSPDLKVAFLCTDPTRKRTGGALLGDRIRMNALSHSNFFMRSLASRGSGKEVSDRLEEAISVCQAVGFDLIFAETSGIGQADDAISNLVDHTFYVMTAEYGAHTQLEKIEMLDVADLVVINKFERRGAVDALRAVRKQVRRNRNLFGIDDSELPVCGTIASQFSDPGVDDLWFRLSSMIILADGSNPNATKPSLPESGMPEPRHIIPPERVNYLAEVSATVRDYHTRTYSEVGKARLAQQLAESANHLETIGKTDAAAEIRQEATEILQDLHPTARTLLEEWPDKVETYDGGEYSYDVRGKTFSVPTKTESLSGSKIPRVALPRTEDKGTLLNWLRKENLPGSFPFTGGVFPFKRADEDPTRMFAGEGPASRTNSRFHLLSESSPYARLSTAFDSVTLYGRDPDIRPDIYGKVGESGVSIFTVDEISQLYDGFDLCDKNTSVSMTINGPAPIILAMFFNAAIRQQEVKFKEKEGREPTDEEASEIRNKTLSSVRGTVQADILKEDQAQNTCIFSTDFSLKLMGDVQQYYIQNNVRNHYSVSISGYHIAEAGANPISQLAFTLANGLTYVEYYRSRGMDVDDFAPNLSFFFSNGMDPEYAVISRVARRIWSIAMRDLYGGNERSQKCKMHIQTSGRSLHAQEMSFNDIRTTLQALLAIQDNANSLHTNAYDEAVTTPTSESVRRALAIQMINNKEFGWNKCENPMQGSYLVEELTDMVEEAVLREFERISERGGVLGAMEMMYQRSKIQDESMYYEELKHSGELPIVGVNMFENPEAEAFDESAADSFDMELSRATPEEKEGCLNRLDEFHAKHADRAPAALAKLQEVARSGENVFAELMETVKVASLGQITEALFDVGGQYRRNM